MENEHREALIKFFAEFQGGGEPSKDVFSRQPLPDLIKGIVIPLLDLLAELSVYAQEDIANDDQGDFGWTQDQIRAIGIIDGVEYALLDDKEYFLEDRMGL